MAVNLHHGNTTLNILSYTIAVILGGMVGGMISVMGLLATCSLIEVIRKIISPNTPEYADIHDAQWEATFVVPRPGKIPDSIRTKIRREMYRYKDIHLVWEAKDQWEREETKPTAQSNQDTLIFGETYDNRFILLAPFDNTAKKKSDKFVIPFLTRLFGCEFL